MALSGSRRKQLARQDKSGNFAIPEKAPGSGSYPIQSRRQASVALSMASGKPEEARVKRAVCRKYPDLPACQSARSSGGRGGRKK